MSDPNATQPLYDGTSPIPDTPVSPEPPATALCANCGHSRMQHSGGGQRKGETWCCARAEGKRASPWIALCNCLAFVSHPAPHESTPETPTREARLNALLGPSPIDALQSAFIVGMDKCREVREAYGEWPSLQGRIELAQDAFPDDESLVAPEEMPTPVPSDEPLAPHEIARIVEQARYVVAERTGFGEADRADAFRMLRFAATVSRLEAVRDAMRENWMTALRETDSLEAENAELREDKERLDWLEAQLLSGRWVSFEREELVPEGGGSSFLGIEIVAGPKGDSACHLAGEASLREAIDAARSASSSEAK